MAIDIGAAAVNRADFYSSGSTTIELENPANETGNITAVELWFASTGGGVKVGTFYGSGASYTSRDSATIGSVTAGSKQTFSGLSISVEAGDFIGLYWSSGTIEVDLSGGTNNYAKSGDQFGTGTQTYTLNGTNQIMSIYGTGTEITAGGGGWWSYFAGWKRVEGILRPPGYGKLTPTVA